MTLDLANNRTCVDFDECSSWGYCDQKCENQEGGFVCSCYDGYTLIGHTHCVVNNSESMRLFVGTDKRIFSVNSSGKNMKTEIPTSALNMEFNYATNKIYFISNKSQIIEADIDGRNQVELPIKGLAMPFCLAIDWITNTLYFSDQYMQIGMYNLDTGYQHSIIINDGYLLNGLAIDPTTGYLFFSNPRSHLRNVGRINRVFMDGSHLMTLRLDKIIKPLHLTLDIVNQRIYWIDYYLNHIQTVDYYGRYRHTIISGWLNIPAPISLTMFENEIFWADLTKMGILKVNKFGGQYSASQIFKSMDEEVKAIKVFHPSSQISKTKSANPCKNANCEQICVLTHTSENAGVGYKCLCQNGYKLMENQINCTKIEKFLLFVCQYAICGIPLTSNPYALDAINPILVPNRHEFIYVTADYTAADEMVYFSEISQATIYKSHLNGSGVEPLVSYGIGFVVGIAVDWVSRNLYFADNLRGTISVIRIDHPDDRRVLISNIGEPRTIVVHPYIGSIFYCDSLRDRTRGPYIARANSDGTNIVHIRRHELGWPNAMSIDYDGNRLYWVDIYFQRIQHSDFNGNDVQTLKGDKILRPVGIAVYKDSIYYIDWQLQSLIRMNKNGHGGSTLRSTHMALIELRIYDKNLQSSNQYHPCARRNGDCSHFCFPISVPHSALGRQLNSHCGCPYGMKLDIGLRNCVPNPEETDVYTCPRGFFQCATKRCIENYRKCDGVNDCFDNSDEAECDIGSTCPPNAFQCNNSLCIHKLWVCDGDYDCLDKSDEQNCRTGSECTETEYKCNNSFCINLHFKCDRANDCGDGSDEGLLCADHTCLSGYFQCDNKLCIAQEIVCDGDNDCYDNSDERDCQPVNCTESQWRCESKIKCIKKEHRCDRFPDCNDESDEVGCSSILGNGCHSREFKCLEGDCILGSWQCDGKQDCEDGSDEDSTCPPLVCPNDWFHCNNGRCIVNASRCNGYNDCGDNSDEAKSLNCPPPPFSCPPNQWECPGGRRICIPDAKVCNGNSDCPDGQDESPLCNTNSCHISNGGCSNYCLQTPLGAQCHCPPGEKLNGSKLCIDDNECEPPGHCSQKCVNTIGSFKCGCDTGYQLLSNRRTCRILRNETVPYMLILTDRKIMKSQMDITSIETINVPNSRYLMKIDVDVANSSIFVGDAYKRSIAKINFDSSNYQQVISKGTGYFGDLAVDWIGRNLYWTDMQFSTVEVATLEGKNRKILFKGNDSNPMSIVLDPREGSRFMFWCDYAYHPSIKRAGMDGTNITVIVSEKIKFITSLAIDYPNQYLYFVDKDLDFIDFCDYNGKHRQRVLSSYSLLQNPRGLTVLEDRVYWVDQGTNTIYHCNKFRCDRKKIISSHFRKLQDIVSYSKVSQPSSSNPCFQSSCSHLCLLSPLNPGYKCACPITMQLDNDKKKCVTVKSEFLLYESYNGITPLSWDNVTQINLLPVRTYMSFLDFDYDSEKNYLYFLEGSAFKLTLKRIKFTATIATKVWPSAFLNPPVGIAIDWISRNLFWISRQSPAIEVMRLDGDVSYHRKILGNNNQPTGVFNPNSICVDPIKMLVYWIDDGGGHVPKKIAEVKMDGSDPRILIQDNLNDPGYLTKDPKEAVLYWSESYLGKIERYDISRKRREVVLENLANPSGLTIYKGFLYYAQYDRMSISVISLAALENGGVELKNRIYKVQKVKVFYPRDLSNETNPCKGSNYGGCQQLCLPNGLNSHTCECNTGLTKNNQGECKAGTSFLIAVVYNSLQGFSLESNDHPEAMVPLKMEDDLTHFVDTYKKENYIFAASPDKGIMKFRPNGSEMETVIPQSSNQFGIFAVAIDWVAGNMYFMNGGVREQVLEVSRLNGTHRLVIAEDLLHSIYGICVNPIKRYIYWTTVGTKPKIERANLDGSDRKVLVRTGIKYPVSITVDIVTHSVYWTDSVISAVQRISYSGGNREYVRGNLVLPSGIAVLGNNVYWSEYSLRKIFSVPKNSKVGAPAVIKSNLVNVDRIAIFDAAIQPEVHNPCSENNGGCEQLCFSLPNNSTAVCKCSLGKLGPDGRTCIPPQEFLIYAFDSQVRGVFLDPNDRAQPIPPLKGLDFPVSLDYDFRENFIYFSQVRSKKLSRVKKGSTVVEDIVYISNSSSSRSSSSSSSSSSSDDFVHSAIGLAVDWLGKKIYWTDAVYKKIVAMNFEFTHKVTLAHVNTARAIALHPCKGYMFWTTLNRQAKIERATMAGNQRTAIVTSGLRWPSGLAIDYQDDKLFWADSKLNRIERSNLDGNYREVIVDISVRPFSVAVFGNYIYWSDWSIRSIFRAEKHTGNNQRHLIKDLHTRPMEVKVFSKAQQTCSDDPCQLFNGGCSHGCHPAPDGKAECSCDDNSGLVLANDDKMCVPKNNNCTSANFICMNGKCIYKSWICDIDDDCGDGSDEHPNLCAQHTCDPSMFRCDNGRCVRPYFRCDYDNDCRDNSDERDCSHPTCGPNEFECKNFRCLNHYRVCDGMDHCLDGFQSDEQDCPNNITCMTGQVKCPNNNICLSSRFLCDGDNDCGDHSDENAMFCQSVTCFPDDFYCSNKHHCIPGAWHCDGDDDCGDMEDEPPSCSNENRTCYGNLFTCNNGKCISQHWVCDGDNDCLDGSDEAEGLNCGERTCPPEYFTCNSNLRVGGSRCIHQRFVCDGDKNCLDGEDELQSCPPRTCSEDEFVCANGFCIKSLFYCDHDNDCGDNSDEPNNCEYPSCDVNLFTCDNKRCIPQRWVCDTDNDCHDNSDEKPSMCFTPAPTCPTGQFLCKNGECIDYSVVCNKQPDCSDSSDEQHCYINECENTELNQCQHKCIDTITSFHCECRPGFSLMNDKKACKDINECEVTPEVCSQQCFNKMGNYTCKCNEGYSKENDHHRCKRKDNITPWLVFSNRYYIRELSTDGQIYRRVAQDFNMITALDYDYIEQRLYYIDLTSHHIQRIFLNGSNKETVVNHGVPYGEGLAVDWVGRKLYWVDRITSSMYVCELNGTNRATLLMRNSSDQSGLSRPRAIIVDPSHGYLYWSDWGVQPCIGRLGMDGSGYTLIITEKLGWPNGLTIDYETNRLWWADAHLDYIEFANVDGSGRRIVIQGKITHVFAITVFEDWIYWTDWSHRSIEKANKYTGANHIVMKNTTHRPMDIHILHPLKQKPHPNPCGMDNGGCSHLCLLAPASKYRCVCPSNFFLNSDNRTCIANCSSSQFRCGITDDRCIPLVWKCDGEKDCKDGLDEVDCPVHICPPGQFQCKNTNCTFSFRVCDLHDDCGDGSDEENCDKHQCPPWQWKCKNNKCIPKSWLCDEENDCGDESDEGPGQCGNTTCKPSQFTCANGACISIRWKCDYDRDCVDGSDESPDLNCANKTCPLNWFKCATNYKCVPSSYLCDGDDDCRDNSDEASENCATCNPDQQFQCDNNRCIPKHWVCDFDDDCKDGSDEKRSLCQNKYRSCSESEFQCENKKCIQGKWRCDYDNDCGDESDEINCAQITCPVGKFRCNNGHCVHQSAVCDGHRDCQDVSDELNCTARFPNGKYCPANVFECKNTICIPRKWQCDGVDDCGDNSDEVASVCKETECSPDTHFRCDNFICIPRWRVCDKVDNCGDASDENNFELCEPVKRRCEANQFKCSTHKQCIHSSRVCDDIIDCKDSSDEQGCFKSSGTVNCSVSNGGCAHNCTDLKQGGFYCSCRKGYNMSATNRKECEDIDECAQWGNNCPQICNNVKGSYKCSCMTGFIESSYPFPRCKLFFVKLPTVYLTMGSEIRQFSPGKRKYSELFSSHRPQALAFNTRHSTIYWTDSTLKSIHRAYVTETPGPAAKLYITGLQEPNGISVDWISGNIYWTDTAKKTISVAAYDGKYSRTLIRNGLRKPYAIVTNSNTGWMYWTNIDSDKPTIERAWMTGEKREVLINERLAYPTGITIDYFMENRVFWCDAKFNVIESIKPDGSDRVTVVSQGLPNPISLDVFEEYMYVLSQNSGKLLRMDKFGRTSNITLQSGLLLPRSVKVFHVLKSSQDAKSECYYKTTCSHLCLLIPDGHVCACPDNSKLLPGSKTNCDAASETSVELAHCVCKNGGTCVRVADNSYTCKCKAGFYGRDCTSVTPEKQLSQLKYTKVTAVVVPVVLLLIIAAVLLAGFFFMKKRGKFFLNKPLIGGPTVPHTPLGVVAYRDRENVQIGTPALSYEITPGQEVNPMENESSSANPACPTNFSNPMYGVDPTTKMEQHQKKAPSSSAMEKNESGSSEKPIVSAKKTAETKSTNENYYASLKTGRSFDPTEDTDKETAGLVKIGEL